MPRSGKAGIIKILFLTFADKPALSSWKFFREGKSGQHRATHPANGWTSARIEIVPQKITTLLWRGKGENVR